MALVDLPLEQLWRYRPDREEPADFDAFWNRTLAEAREFPLDPVLRRQDGPLTLVDAFEVEFTGFGGHRIGGWFLRPSNRPEPLPCVVRYLGYTVGRGRPHQWLSLPACGLATLVMDTRGQSDTADPAGGSGAEVPGFLTRGLTCPETYYYRRVYVDAVRAVEAAGSLPGVDPARIAVAAGSQGAGVGLAVAGLASARLRAVLLDVPSLTMFRRATEIGAAGSRAELVAYLKANRGREDDVFATLSYFDGVNFAARARVPAWFSAALMDPVCPPSTVFAAYHHYAGDKHMRVWPYNGHEGGGGDQEAEHLELLASLLGDER
ncbi:acetylxylan esterase [Actinophytocola gossypii]|uniref:Acetylxylan esterase n=1 Tax=Actinophytocola gossypii TaxID=2812003 RepID=A0ABT2J5F7_9PSEU|nr:acetylxylan esterase [Actinophytocola gossypii]MCT2583100.1 acetylxylan esterase [Actinophytocola gossypii]